MSLAGDRMSEQAIELSTDDQEACNRIVELTRAEFAGTKIFARSYDRGHTLQLLANLCTALGWSRERLDAFLRSPKSPVKSTRWYEDSVQDRSK